MTNTRLVAFGYIALAAVAGFFLEHVLLQVFGSFAPTQPLTRELAGGWSWCTFIGLAIAAVAAIYLWTNQKTHDVSLEIAGELRKTSWPSMAETRAATVAVIVASIISALLLGFFDIVWQFLTDKIQNPTL